MRYQLEIMPTAQLTNNNNSIPLKEGQRLIHITHCIKTSKDPYQNKAIKATLTKRFNLSIKTQYLEGRTQYGMNSNQKLCLNCQKLPTPMKA